MDHFIADLFDELDRTRADRLSKDVVDDAGAVSLERILGHGALHRCLALDEAFAASLGKGTTPLDTASFAAALTSAGTRQALGAALGGAFPALRSMPQKEIEDLVQRAEGVLAKAHAEIAGSSARCYRALAARLERRFGARPGSAPADPPRDARGLLVAYAAIVRASAAGDFGAEWDGGVAAQAEAAGRALEALDLVESNPLTGNRFGGGGGSAAAARLSCADAMLRALRLDGYMWRTHSGGTLVMAQAAGALPSSGRVLVVDEAWAARVLPSLPPGLFARVLAPASLLRERPWLRGGAVKEVVGVAADACADDIGASVVVSADPVPPRMAAGGATSWVPACAPGAFGQALVRCMWEGLARVGEAEGSRALREFVARYLHARGLLAGDAARHALLSSSAAWPPEDSGELLERAVVVIDTRSNPMSAASVLIALDNLERASWGALVFTSTAGAGFFREALPTARVEVLEELDAPAFDTEAYNRLLKDARFWRRIRARHVLLVQDDGLLVRPGLEASGLLRFEYVGAPWTLMLPQLTEAGAGPEFVGNGGLSLRRVDFCARVCELRAANRTRWLFNSCLQPEPEDVFFAAEAAAWPGGTPCTAADAASFAVEEGHLLPPRRAAVPLGFHKPWGYHPIEHVRAFFAEALKDAHARPSAA